MDVRRVFQAASSKLMADFEESAAIRHSGGKGSMREDALIDFMANRLPLRYAVGKGEVINSDNVTSGQLDVVVYDPYHCPKIIASASHSVFPIESIYGAISVKSTLAKRDLEDAYSNLASLQKVVDRSGFQIGKVGLVSGMHHPRPFTAIFAYRSDRKLETIAEQIAELDKGIPALEERPDCVCILGLGIIGPRTAVRGEFNRATLPLEYKDICSTRKTGRHTLFQFYIQMIREMSNLTMRPLDIASYEHLPEVVGEHRVRRHDIFARQRDGEGRPDFASKLSQTAIELIVAKSVYMTRLEAIAMMTDAKIEDSASPYYAGDVCCYNPRQLPPMDSDFIREIGSGNRPSRAVFQPHLIQIDNTDYFVDLGALSEEHFELNYEMTYDELLS